MSKKSGWFDVDKEGLAKLLEGRGKIALIHELIQNSWDTDTKTVVVKLDPLKSKPLARLEVIDDDPNGFADLTHAYTLFAESNKKGDVTKRGRFNLGEKLVLALCEEASIASTKGTVSFYPGGERRSVKQKTNKGSVFSALIRMTRAELAEIEERIFDLIPPPGIITIFNGKELEAPKPVTEIEATLPTVIGDEGGVLRRSRRKTKITIYDKPGDGCIYEMGIPVVETGDSFHVDVHQKVPLNMDRDNVTPAYLRELRAAVLNATSGKLLDDEACEAWVTDAMQHPDVSDEAVKDVVTSRFGEGAVVYDPSDREANHKATAADRTVVHGGSLPKGAWENVRRAEALPSAGKVFPTKKGSVPSTPVEPNPDMKRVANFAKSLFAKIVDPNVPLRVNFLSAPDANVLADFGRDGLFNVTVTVGDVLAGWNIEARDIDEGHVDSAHLRFNVAHLGEEWFRVLSEDGVARVADLLVHEFAHFYESNHLSDRYHEATTKLAGKIAALSLTEPGFFCGLLDWNAPGVSDLVARNRP